MKPVIAIHKFASCDGCQLAFLNAGLELITLSELVDIAHFPEAGPVDEERQVDIAFVEGSVTTPADVDRIRRIRTRSLFLVTIGACATAGGIQALRNYANVEDWTSAIYASPEYIQTLASSTPIREHVNVDLELWGCPVSSEQIMRTIRDLLSGVIPRIKEDKVCLECKRQGQVCVMVTRNLPCMGPVTRTGCGAICPRYSRDCYGCYGPAENCNSNAMINRLEGIGLVPSEIARRFVFINSQASEFRTAGETALAKAAEST